LRSLLDKGPDLLQVRVNAVAHKHVAKDRKPSLSQAQERIAFVIGVHRVGREAQERLGVV